MTNAVRNSVVVATLALVGLAGFLLTPRSHHIQTDTPAAPGLDASSLRRSEPQTNPPVPSPAPLPARLFILSDTTTDSPGTNLETRIVTFTAEVGGTPPIFQQWKVNKGSGFAAVSGSATNTTLIVSNARVADTGLYALFATNRLGATNTTPVPLVVVEGTD